jgi:hypothetical protein
MTAPTVTETQLVLEPVSHDPFIDDVSDVHSAPPPPPVNRRRRIVD